MQLTFTVRDLKPRPRRRRARESRKLPRTSTAVRTIVLAFQIEQAIHDGRAESYADVARRIGMTRARVAQLTKLLRLPTEILETLLLSDSRRVSSLTERQLRPIAAVPDRATQIDRFRELFKLRNAGPANRIQPR